MNDRTAGWERHCLKGESPANARARLEAVGFFGLPDSMEDDMTHEERIAALETELRRCRRERLMLEADLATPINKPMRVGKVTWGERVQQALPTAWAEWTHRIQEPPGNGFERIDEYIRGPQGLGWDWEREYTRNGQFAWCGAFMAYCWGAAGLRADIRRTVCPSTYRLHKWCREHDRRVALEDVQPGDVLIVGREDSRWGDHITLVRGQDKFIAAEKVEHLGVFFATFEGNAKGEGYPEGATYEGVVRQVRPLKATKPSEYRALWALRWREEDFE